MILDISLEERLSKMTVFRNESCFVFIDISNESERIYTFSTGHTYCVDHPEKLHISASGGHRIFDGEYSHYIQPLEGWAIHWLAKDGDPHFVL